MPGAVVEPLRESDASTVRAAIAHGWLRASEAVDARLGAVTLRPHQVDAAGRLRAALAEFGGALLADEVGLGKTFVALAVARDAERLAVVAPAALRDMWRGALADAGLHAPFTSFESLGRRRDDGATPCETSSSSPALLVIDEAHHARNPATRRYRALARLAAGARVLLLSATPVHNRRADLFALLALFLGARARALDDAALARLVVRRDRDALGAPGAIGAASAPAARVPDVAPPRWLSLPADDALLDAILALPPPIAPSDGGDGGALLAHSLVRQWASSDAALRAAIRRRLTRAAALAASLERGIHPSRGELAAWTGDGEAVQLAFAELLAPTTRRRRDGAEVARLLAAVRAHDAALRDLLGALRASDDRDAARAALLRELCARHAGEKVVAFASFAETVESLFRRLRASQRVAALTAHGAVVAGGALARRDALARFAPRASRSSPPRAADGIDLLLATDLLSEGVNLHDASVVVHLDLPWTPARLEQRVGRVARLGSRHDLVAVYALSPPASAEAVLRTERRLREKLREAAGAVGVAGAILPALSLLSESAPPHGDAEVPESAVVDAEALRRTLLGWLAPGPTARDECDRVSAQGGAESMSFLAAAVRAGTGGFLAFCATRDGRTTLVASVASVDGGAVSDAPAVVRRAVELACSPGVPLDPTAVGAALRRLDAWASGRRSADAAGLADVAAARARRRLVERIAAITRRAPRHERSATAALAHRARRAALAPCGAAGEWVLAELARAELSDDAWLRAVAAFGQAAEAGSNTASAGGDFTPLALLLLQAQA